MNAATEPVRVPIGKAAKTISKLVRKREAAILTNRGFDVGLLLPMPPDAAHREYRIELTESQGCEVWTVSPASPKT